MQRTDINDSIQYSANFISWKGTERFLRVYWVLYSFYQIKFLTPFGKDSCKSSKDASISLALAFNLEILCWEKCQKNFVKVNNYIEWRKRKKNHDFLICTLVFFVKYILPKNETFFFKFSIQLKLSVVC